jgi:hypothetical protein
MNVIRSVVLITLVCSGLTASAAPGDPDLNYKQLGEISSSVLRAIEKALPVLRRQRPDWVDYRIEVAEVDEAYMVAFWRPEDIVTLTYDFNLPPEARTRQIARGALTVYLDKKTLRVIRYTSTLHF